jgi:hypothetical protein
MSIRAHRFVAAGALGVAAVAAPIAIALVGNTATESVAGPACLAWYGNQEDGVCLSYSNGNGVNVGTPDLGLYGPNSGSMPGGGLGVTTGALLPGQTWTVPIG